MKNSCVWLPILSLALLLCLILSCQQQEEKVAVEEKPTQDLNLEKIPEVVMNALNTKFPDAEIHKWTQEEEGEIILYDIEFEQVGKKFEADIKEDGTIHNWEKAIDAGNLPEAVRKSIDEKYANATVMETMEISAVSEGKDVLEGYEVVLRTVDNKEFELTVAPDGKILEDSGEQKPDE